MEKGKISKHYKRLSAAFGAVESQVKLGQYQTDKIESKTSVKSRSLKCLIVDYVLKNGHHYNYT